MAGNVFKNTSFVNLQLPQNKKLKTKYFKDNTYKVRQLGNKFKKYKNRVKSKFPSLLCAQIPTQKNIVKLLVGLSEIVEE